MLRKVVTKQLAAADADGIAEAQTLAGSGDLDLDGVFVVDGVAVLDTGRRVLITSAGDDSGITFTIYGSLNGIDLVEVVAGPDTTTAQSELDFDKVTRIVASGATAGDVEVGTNGVGSTRWVSVDGWIAPTGIAVAVVVDGTVNYDVEYTYDQYWEPPEQPGGPTPLPTVWDDPVLVGDTANGQTTFSFPVTGIRLTINSGDGSAEMTVYQAGGLS